MGLLSDLFSKAKDVGEGVKNITDGIGENTSKIITTIKDKVPPEMRGEIEKLEIELDGQIKKLEIETSVKVMEFAQEAQKGLYDFTIQYEGSADQVPKWILVLRSIIRPVITICMFFSLMFFIGWDIRLLVAGETDKMILILLPQAYWVILGIILGFWFGGKAGENIVDKLKGGMGR